MSSFRTHLQYMPEKEEPAATGRATVPIRMPRELHKRLKELAWQHKFSLNRLCVEALEHVCGELQANDQKREAVA